MLESGLRYLSFFSFLVLIYMLISKTFHTLSVLLLLETGMLISLFFMSVFLGSTSSLLLLLMGVFTFAVCEACLGISVLIKSVRSLGSDYMSQVF